MTDSVPFYRELFAADELLVLNSVEEYHDMVRQALNDPDLNQRYRLKGFEAVLARHTYAHRAPTILTYLGIRSAAHKASAAQ